MSVPNSFFAPWMTTMQLPFVCFLLLWISLCVLPLSELCPFWNTTTAIRQHGSHYSLCKAPTGQTASWFRFPHTTLPKAQRELARPASRHIVTPSHKINRTVSVWPVSGHSARQRTTRSTASDGLVDLWPPSRRTNNNINSIRRSGRPLATQSEDQQ